MMLQLLLNGFILLYHILNRALSMSFTHHAMSQCVRHKLRDITWCVHHTLLRDVALCPSHTTLYHAVCPSHTPGSRGVQSYTRKTISECPPREARGVLLAKHAVSVRLYHAVTRVR